MSNKTFLILILVSLATIGAGCSSSSSSNTNKTATSSQLQVVKKNPATEQSKNPIYDFCESKGYQIIIRFDKTTNGSKAYCHFDDSKECEAESFAKGTCSKENGAVFYNPTPTLVPVCTITDPVVCGADGKTYINHCSAEKQNVVVKRQGNCADEQTNNIQPTNPLFPDNPVTKNSNPVATTNPVTTPSTNTNLDWLKTATDILGSGLVNNPRAFIEKCNYGGTILYFASEGCTNCFTTLYTENGSILCYPNNDISNSCPTYFNKSNRSKNCSLYWKDKR